MAAALVQGHEFPTRLLLWLPYSRGCSHPAPIAVLQHGRHGCQSPSEEALVAELQAGARAKGTAEGRGVVT